MRICPFLPSLLLFFSSLNLLLILLTVSFVSFRHFFSFLYIEYNLSFLFGTRPTACQLPRAAARLMLAAARWLWQLPCCCNRRPADNPSARPLARSPIDLPPALCVSSPRPTAPVIRPWPPLLSHTSGCTPAPVPPVPGRLGHTPSHAVASARPSPSTQCSPSALAPSL